MEPDELKLAWQSLERRLAQHDTLQREVLRERKLDTARRGLRPLFWGQLLQFLLGIGLIALGVACWTGNTGVPGLLAAGILVHAFGVLNAAAAGIILGLQASIDYAAPVLAIQKRMALLLRFQSLNAVACGLPWWIMWVPVVVAFAGLRPLDPQAGTPAWIWLSLAVGVAGLLGTWGLALWRRRSPASSEADGEQRADGTDGIRRSQRILDEIARFERG